MTAKEEMQFLATAKNTLSAEQYKSMHLYILTMQDNSQELYSYRTRVGIKYPRATIWRLEKEKLSRTTSKQLNVFAAEQGSVIWGNVA
jgi:hypothetical protein